VIVVYYDGLSRPSEVHIDHIVLWVRFYDLPPVMLSLHSLEVRWGRYIKMDTRYPGYMCVRVDFPLVNPLMPSITVRIKARCAMEIKLKYENVAVKAVQPRVVKSLFQVGVVSSRAASSGSKAEGASRPNDQSRGLQEGDLEGNTAVSDDFVQSVKSMHVCQATLPKAAGQYRDREVKTECPLVRICHRRRRQWKVAHS
jgi:hypothetical protein